MASTRLMVHCRKISFKNRNSLKAFGSNIRDSSSLHTKKYIEGDIKDRAVDTDKPVLDFTDPKDVYKHKTILDLLRAMCVLNICSYDFLVDNSEKLMKSGSTLLGRRLMSSLMRATFYRQFVVENSREEISTCVCRLKEAGIGSLLFVPMEEDVDESCGEDGHYNCSLSKVLECINMAAGVQPQFPMIQLKLTSLLPATLCADLSKVVPEPSEDPDIVKAVAKAMKTGEQTIPKLPGVDMEQLYKGLARMNTIGEMAVARQVIVMVDAEYTYINPGLNLLALAMMLNFNSPTPLIFYTYQNYLKQMAEFQGSSHVVSYRLRILNYIDIEFTTSCGVGFGAKVVRGAYLERERRLAKEQVYPDPVHETFGDTTAMYNDTMDLVLSSINRDPGKVRVILGSHNTETMERAINRMRWYDIEPHSGSVFLGQVYGLADHVTYLLGSHGYPVYKSVPLGTLEDTIPYLARRAQENRGVLKGVGVENKLLREAVRSRVFGISQ